MDLFSRVIFLNISCGFNYANWHGWFFCEDLFSRILVLSIFDIFWFFSWFVLELVVCESRGAYPNCSIFQIALFRHKRLNSWLNVYDDIKRSRYNKKSHFSFFLFLTLFCLRCRYLYCLISCKICLTWPSLIDREPNGKM